MFGYSGKILHIDLASQKHWIEENPKIGTRCGSGGLQWLLVSVGKISLPNVTPCRLKIQFASQMESSLELLSLWVENLVWLRNHL